MAKSSPKTRKKKAQKVPIYELPGKGKMDPDRVRQAVIAVHNRMIKENAEARAKAKADAKSKAEANGAARAAEAE